METTTQNSKSVFQYDLQGNFIKEFNSIASASKECNISVSGISSNCNGIQKSTGGFIFSFERKEKIEAYTNSVTKKVSQYDLQGNFIKEFDSITLASKETGVEGTLISDCCKGITNRSGKFIFKFEKSDKVDSYVPRIKSVSQYDLDGELIKTFKSISEAIKETGIGNIAKVCKNTSHYKTAGGYKWSYTK